MKSLLRLCVLGLLIFCATAQMSAGQIRCLLDLQSYQNGSYVSGQVSKQMAQATSKPNTNDVGDYYLCQSLPGAHLCTFNLNKGARVRSGQCLPTSCTPETFPSNLVPTGYEMFCGDNSEGSLGAGGWIMIVVIILLCGLMAVGTLLESGRFPPKQQNELPKVQDSDVVPTCLSDVWPPSKKAQGYLKAFGLRHNVAKLWERSEQRGFKILDGLRAISLGWIVLGHTWHFGTQVGLENAMYYYWGSDGPLQRPTFQLLVGFHFAVDTFFFLSGFLLAHVLYDRYKKEGGFSIWRTLVHRYLRLTPALAFTIFFYYFVSGKMGSGPFWHAYTDLREQCSSNWWSNLLYINNFYPTNFVDTCMPYTWYMATEMQFTIIGVLVMALYVRRPKIAWVLCALFVVLTVSVSAGLVHHNEYSQVMNESQDALYDKPYGRISPYALGMMICFLLKDHKMKEWLQRIGQQRAWALHLARLLSIGVLIGVVVGLYPDVKDWNVWSVSENTAYTSLVRTGWGIGIAGIVALCLAGYGGPTAAILSWRPFDLIAKLTYCTYLLHPLVIRLVYYNQERMLVYDPWMLTALTGGFLVLSLAVAAVLHLLVEVPFINMSRLLLDNKPISPPKSPRSITPSPQALVDLENQAEKQDDQNEEEEEHYVAIRVHEKSDCKCADSEAKKPECKESADGVKDPEAECKEGKRVESGATSGVGSEQPREEVEMAEV